MDCCNWLLLTFPFQINTVIMLLKCLALVLCKYIYLSSVLFLLHLYISYSIRSERLHIFVLFASLYLIVFFSYTLSQTRFRWLIWNLKGGRAPPRLVAFKIGAILKNKMSAILKFNFRTLTQRRLCWSIWDWTGWYGFWNWCHFEKQDSCHGCHLEIPFPDSNFKTLLIDLKLDRVKAHHIG